MENQVFPRTKEEALAMLYVSKSAAAGITPEEITRLYDDAIKRIRNEFGEIAYEESGGCEPKIGY